MSPEELKIREEFLETFEHKFTVDIDMALFGIRNLIKKAIKPRVKIRLTDSLYEDES